MGNTSGKPVVFTDEVNLNHFRLLRVVGKGAFGKVRVVERKDTGLTFALKYIRKDEVVRSESVRNIIRERRMLEHLNHPFLCNLRYSFQDMEYMYIVVDLMNGGDLRFHISRKTMTEAAVRFWMAELACALKYIHSQGIVHRDLKPDNVLLDSEGHVHLADFNVASEFNPRKKLHSRSGTLAYLAPEVYGGHGYLSEVDWWSLGVTFYECIYNKRPFDSHGHEKLEKEIMAADIKYPLTNPPVTQVCLHAISSLLEKDITKRIGAISFESFTQNPFFSAIDFELLEQKQIDPIFIPSSEKTNFDATYDLEELLLEEAPLEARARRQKPRAQLKEDATEKEIRNDELHRMIETLFEPFDYTLTPTDPNTLPATEKPLTSDSTATEHLHPGDMHHRNIETGVSQTTTPNGSPPLMPSPSLHRTNTTGGAPSIKAGPRHRSGTRSTSRSTLGERVGRDPHPPMPGAPHGSALADKNATMPADAKGGPPGQKPSGMLAFLSRKGGRARSPKPREAGVLGKEGCRVIVNSEKSLFGRDKSH